MTEPTEYSFIRFLEAKRTVDDRALNQQVWRCLLGELQVLPRERSLQVMEVGAGIGTMLQRTLEWGFDRDMDYIAVDSDPSLLARAAERLPAWARGLGWQIEQPHECKLILSGPRQRVMLEFVSQDIFEIPERPGGFFDLIIAHAFLDLVELKTALPHLLSLTRPDGLFYFTLVFDGATILRPPVDPDFDSLIEARYHRTMDERVVRGRPSGHSRTGRMLLETLSAKKASILAAGGSDWVVNPPYPADEAYFLHHILHFIENALKDSPDLDLHRLEQWIRSRHLQVEEGRLIYIAHQLDVLGHP